PPPTPIAGLCQDFVPVAASNKITPAVIPGGQLAAAAATTCLLSGENATPFASPGMSTLTLCCPVAGSHTRTVLSAPAVAINFAFGEKATACTAPLCPVNGTLSGCAKPTPSSFGLFGEDCSSGGFVDCLSSAVDLAGAVFSCACGNSRGSPVAT